MIDNPEFEAWYQQAAEVHHEIVAMLAGTQDRDDMRYVDAEILLKSRLLAAWDAGRGI